jgi:hypothetical protein
MIRRGPPQHSNHDTVTVKTIFLRRTRRECIVVTGLAPHDSLEGNTHDGHDPRKGWCRTGCGGTTVIERALPIPLFAVGEDLRTRERINARDLVRGFCNRIKQLLRALINFFASGGPLS